jgi:hypothetical protein
MSGEMDVRYIALYNCFLRAKAPLCGRKTGLGLLKFHLDLEAWVLPGDTRDAEPRSLQQRTCQNIGRGRRVIYRTA